MYANSIKFTLNDLRVSLERRQAISRPLLAATISHIEALLVEVKKQERAKEALNQCSPVFEYYSGYIFDGNGNMFLDNGEGEEIRVRGWGRLGKLENGDQVQDAIGQHIANALNEYWEKHKPK